MGKRLSDFARNLNMAVLTINTIVRGCDQIKNAVIGSMPMKSTVITTARSGIIWVTIVRFSVVVKCTLILIIIFGLHKM